MGRRSSKSGHGVGAVPGYDTVGMTILPGHPLPDWAAPEATPVDPDVFEADHLAFDAAPASGPEMVGPFEEAAATAPAAGPAEAAAFEATERDLSPALVGAGVGAAAATHTTAAGPGDNQHPLGAGYPGAGLPGAGYSGAGYSGAGYGPAAGTVGAAATTGAGHPATGHPAAGYGTAGQVAPGVGAPPGYAPAAAYGGAAPSASVSAPTAPASPFTPPAPRVPESPAGGAAAGHPTMGPGYPGTTVSTTGSSGQAPAPGWPPADHGHGHATATATLDSPSAASAPAPADAPVTDHPAPATPSQGWTSPDRPELSPEHVALLTWWAEMIAKGQFPSTVGVPGAPPAPPARESRRRRRHSAPAGDAPHASGRRTTAVLLGLGGVAAIGLAIAFGPGVVAALTEDPAPVPASNLTMPTSVGDLVAVSSPDVSEQLQSMLGLGLRPAGITTTAGYGTDPASPVVLASMATTTPADGDAAQQIATWADRMGATVGEPVAGSSGTGGITCAPVTAIPDALPGSFCVWTGSDRRGQSYAVGATTDVALQQTAQLRDGIVAAG